MLHLMLLWTLEAAHLDISWGQKKHFLHGKLTGLVAQSAKQHFHNMHAVHKLCSTFRNTLASGHSNRRSDTYSHNRQNSAK